MTKTLGDTRCYCVWLRPGDASGSAGRERYSLPASGGGKGRGGKGRGAPLVYPLHSLARAKPSVSTGPSCRAERAEATARLTMASAIQPRALGGAVASAREGPCSQP